MKNYIFSFFILLVSSISYASSHQTLLEKRLRLRVDICEHITTIYTNFFESYEGISLNSQYNESDILLNEDMRNHPGNKVLLEIMYRLQSRFQRYCEIHAYQVPNCIYSMLDSFGSKFKEYDPKTKKWLVVSQDRAEELIGFYFVKFFTFFETPSK